MSFFCSCINTTNTEDDAFFMHNISEGGWTGVLEHLQVHFPSNIGVAMMRERISNTFLHVFVMLETSVKVFGLEGMSPIWFVCVCRGKELSSQTTSQGQSAGDIELHPQFSTKELVLKNTHALHTHTQQLAHKTHQSQPATIHQRVQPLPRSSPPGKLKFTSSNFNYNLFSTNGTKWKAKYVHWCIII